MKKKIIQLARALVCSSNRVKNYACEKKLDKILHLAIWMFHAKYRTKLASHL